MNIGLDAPVEPIDALQHYRLISEQVNDSAALSQNYTQTVKAFEYVRGARLKGEGRIEVTIQTDLGRTFVYRQESENGLFILPYADKKFSLSGKNDGSLSAGLFGKDHRGL